MLLHCTLSVAISSNFFIMNSLFLRYSSCVHPRAFSPLWCCMLRTVNVLSFIIIIIIIFFFFEAIDRLHLYILSSLSDVSYFHISVSPATAQQDWKWAHTFTGGWPQSRTLLHRPRIGRCPKGLARCREACLRPSPSTTGSCPYMFCRDVAGCVEPWPELRMRSVGLPVSCSGVVRHPLLAVGGR